MFKDFKLPLGLSFMEALTLIFFIALGYLCIYRYSFYNTLGISWYLSSITPAQILASSFNSIFNLVMGGAITFLFFKISILFNSYREKFLYVVLFIIIFTWSILMLSESSKLFPNFSLLLNTRELSSTSILHYCIVLFLLRLVIRTHNALMRIGVTQIEYIEVPDKVLTPKATLVKFERERKESLILLISLVFVIVVSTPFITANKDALFLLNNREHSLNLVKVKSNKERWYLIEMFGDKILLIKENKNKNLKNDFKLIEYKDIENISAPQKSDIDGKMVEYFSNKIAS